MAARANSNWTANGAASVDQATHFLNLITQLRSRRLEQRPYFITWTDPEIQREKRQIKLEIEVTKYMTRFDSGERTLTVNSTAKLAPPLSETELIQSLVCKAVNSGILQG